LALPKTMSQKPRPTCQHLQIMDQFEHVCDYCFMAAMAVLQTPSVSLAGATRSTRVQGYFDFSTSNTVRTRQSLFGGHGFGNNRFECLRLHTVCDCTSEELKSAVVKPMPSNKTLPCSDSVGTLSALQVINLSNKIVIARLEIVLQASAPHMLV